MPLSPLSSTHFEGAQKLEAFTEEFPKSHHEFLFSGVIWNHRIAIRFSVILFHLAASS